MIFTLFKRLLSKFGYDMVENKKRKRKEINITDNMSPLERLKAVRNANFHNTFGLQFGVPMSVVHSLEKDLARAIEAGLSYNFYEGFKNVRTYLCDSRLSIYHGVLAYCEEAGISFKEKKVADIGTLYGYLVRIIKQKYQDCNIIGYDITDENFALANYLAPNVNFIVKDFISNPDRQFDIVFFLQVFEHLPHPSKGLKNQLENLAKGGCLILTVPDGRKDTSKSEMKTINGIEVHGHINFWGKESWKYFIEDNSPSRYVVRTLNNSNHFAIIWK